MIIQIPKPVQKQLYKLDKSVIANITSTLKKFANGEKCDSKKLKGFANRYRIRVSDYRAVFDVIIQDDIMLVIRVAHRQEVYKGIEKL